MLDELAPVLVEELDKIDASMAKVKALIRPHTSFNRAVDYLPALSRHYDERLLSLSLP